MTEPAAGQPTIESLAREFFAAIEDRDPRRLHATLAEHATFRALPHSPPIRPANDIVAYFGTVVSSYPSAHWEVSDVIAERGSRGDPIRRPRVLDPPRPGSALGAGRACSRAAQGRIVNIVGYYDSTEFRRVFWEES